VKTTIPRQKNPINAQDNYTTKVFNPAPMDPSNTPELTNHQALQGSLKVTGRHSEAGWK